MPLNVAAVQEALRADGLDGWLLYDFQGSNPVSYRMAGMGGSGHLATRRWFYLIPATGEPRALVHAIERYNLDHLPGDKTVYAGREVRGFEADRAARQVLQEAGFGDAIMHRTGHSLGENVHGNGAHLDDYETHDERRLLPGSGFTIEPGLYFKDFGVRTEINMVWTGNGPEVTGPRQASIVTLV